MAAMSSCSFDVLAAVYMSLWFSLSCSIAIVNKFIFSSVQFTFPVTLTAYHMLAQAVMAPLAAKCIPSFQLQNLSRSQFRKNILPVAAILSFEVCFNNLGLRYIPVSFVQTVRSLTPLCAALVSVVVLRKRLTGPASLTLIPICAGVGLSTVEEVSFHAGGFCATIFSCFLTAGKLALTSRLFGNSLKLDPINALRYMSPVGFFVLSPIALLLEGRQVAQWLSQRSLLSSDVFVVAVSALLALVLNLSIFLLLRRTNAVAVAVAGNFKVVVTIVISVVIFRNPVTHLGAVGCAIALAGCTSYGLVKEKFVASDEEPEE